MFLINLQLQIQDTHDVRFLMVIAIAVMLLLFVSFLIAFMLAQRKKLQYHKDVQKLREQQQNQLIEAAVRSEEIERLRIAETLHDVYYKGAIDQGGTLVKQVYGEANHNKNTQTCYYPECRQTRIRNRFPLDKNKIVLQAIDQ